MTPEIVGRIERASALIFDCDGTLIDSSTVQVLAWSEGFQSDGHLMTADWYLARNGLSESLLVEAVEQETGRRLDRDRVIQTMRRAYQQNLRGLREIEGVTRLAREYSGKKPMAVATSGPAASVLPSLAILQLDDLFDAIVTVDDVARPKPFPDLFLEAARRLRVEPSACLVFEDSPTGIESALAAGCEVIDIATLIRAPSDQ